jgi:hypothetical protein
MLSKHFTRTLDLMHAALRPRLATTLPRRCMQVLVVPLCASGDDRKPVRLLPSRRLPAAILPIVGGPARASGGGDDLGGGVIGKLVGEGHGRIVARKIKSAMPKIILAIRRHCRQSIPVSATPTINSRVSYKASKYENRHGTVIATEESRVQVLWDSHTDNYGLLRQWKKPIKTWVAIVRLSLHNAES